MSAEPQQISIENANVQIDHGEVVTPDTPSLTPSNTVDVIDDLGYAGEGEEDVAQLIKDHYESADVNDHRYYFPSGHNYFWNTHLNFQGHEYCGLVTEQPQTIVVGPDVNRLTTLVGNYNQIEDIEFDISVHDEACAGITRGRTHVYGSFQNVSIKGRRDQYKHDSDRHTFKMDADRKNAVNHMFNISLPDGDEPHGDRSRVGHAIAYAAETDHVGTNIWEQCMVAEYHDNAFYVRDGVGQNLLVNCYTENCSGAHFRLGDNDRAVNIEMYQDKVPANNYCGLWLQEGSGQSVDGFKATIKTDKVPEIIRNTSKGPVQLSNVTLIDKSDHDGRLIRLGGSDKYETFFENLTIRDETKDGTGGYMVYVRESNVRFEGGNIHFDGSASRHGVMVEDVDDVRIEGVDFHTGAQSHASVRFSGSGSGHRITNCDLDEAGVWTDTGITLEDVLFTENSHPEDGGSFSANHVNWKGSDNFGFNISDLPTGSSSDDSSSGEEETEPERETSSSISHSTTTLMSGTKWETDLHELDSGNDGPTVFVVAGQHGIEDAGWMAAEDLLELTPKTGKLVVIPRFDQTAIDKGVYNGDELNMNRQFPTGREPYVAMAQAGWDQIKKYDPDLLMDLHSSQGIKSTGSGVGQCVFPTPGASGLAESVRDYLNENFVTGYESKYDYTVGNEQDGSNDLLTHKANHDLDGEALLAEPTREGGVPMEDQVEWNFQTVIRACWVVGLNFEEDVVA